MVSVQDSSVRNRRGVYDIDLVIWYKILGLGEMAPEMDHTILAVTVAFCYV